MELNELLIPLSFCACIFWIFQLIFAFVVFVKSKKHTSDLEIPSVSVIVPAFNEKLERLIRTLEHIKAQINVNMEIIVVDDGSHNPIDIADPAIHLIRSDINQGKRHAQMLGFLQAKHPWLVTVDSDTLLEPDAIYNLYCDMINQGARAATGTILLANENQNLLTKMTACMYWFSFNQERASQSYFGCVTCCAGALSIYEKDVVIEHKDTYLNQTFLGKPCMAGDDRHLTNIFLLNGRKVIWSGRSRANTYSPSTYRKFFKQQLRWTRSHVTALWFLLKNIHKWPLMFYLFVFKFNFRYFYMFIVYVYMVHTSVQQRGVMPLVGVGLAVGVIALIKSIIALIYTGDWKFVYLALCSLFTFYVLNPVVYYGALTPTKVHWLTRNKPV